MYSHISIRKCQHIEEFILKSEKSILHSTYKSHFSIRKCQHIEEFISKAKQPVLHSTYKLLEPLNLHGFSVYQRFSIFYELQHLIIKLHPTP